MNGKGRYFYLFVFVFSVFFTARPPFAQQGQIEFERIVIGDGLNQNLINSIIQDNQGFIWIATDDGICRYDGYGVIRYKNDPDNPNSISSNLAKCLVAGHDGIIWIRTSAGLDKFDPTKETFTHYPIHPENESERTEFLKVLEDHLGNIWVGSDGGGCSCLTGKRGNFPHSGIIPPIRPA